METLRKIDSKNFPADEVAAKLLQRLYGALGQDADDATLPNVQRGVLVYVNGVKHELDRVDPGKTLYEFLHETGGLSGTKSGCSEGGCGACAVMVSHWDAEAQKVVHRGVTACLLPLLYCDHMMITTVEGVGSVEAPHPVQERIALNHGTQCGYCTPGFVMSTFATLAEQPDATVGDIEDAVAGNLCRCTGYRPILEAVETFGSDYKAEHASELTAAARTAAKKKKCGGDCATCTSCGDGDTADKDIDAWGDTAEQVRATVPFPDELKHAPLQHLLVSGRYSTWFRPASLDALLAFKAHELTDMHDVEMVAGKTRCSTFQGSELVCGNTDLGFKHRYHPDKAPRLLVSLTGVSELRAVRFDDAGMHVGAGTTISEFQRVCLRAVKERPRAETRFAAAFAGQTRLFANKLVRNIGTLGGSLCAADALSDLYPVWLASNSVITTVAAGGESRQVPVREFIDVELGKIKLWPDEIVLSIFTPWSRANTVVRAWKVSKRRDDCQATITSCLTVTLDAEKKTVADAWCSFGAVARHPASFDAFRTALVGKPPTDAAFRTALVALDASIDVARRLGSVELRKAICRGLFVKFWVATAKELGLATPPANVHNIDELFVGWKARWNAERAFHQDFAACVPQPSNDDVPAEVADLRATCDVAEMPLQPETEAKLAGRGRHAVGVPEAHHSALAHATGKATYVGDIPLPSNGLYAAPVLSKRAHAKIVSIDASDALRLPHVHDFVCAKDIPGVNVLGCMVEDEEVFASEKVTFFGQMIGIVLAESQALATEAARTVVVEYEDLPAILTVEDAIEKESFFHDWHREIKHGDAASALDGADVVVEGVVKSGPQEHFYIETQNVVVFPGADEITVIAASQNPSKMQDAVSKVLDIPLHKVVSKVMRLGGGFGGKQDRPQFITAAAALAAVRTGRPVRFELDRTEDIQTSGMRHGYLNKYRVGCDKDGKLVGIELHQYTDGGHTLDLTAAALDRGLWAGEGGYYFPNGTWRGTCVRTNKVSNTAYRGFGVPQAMTAVETAIEHLAQEAGLAPEVLRERNLLKAGDPILTNTYKLPECNAERCWTELKSKSNYAALRADVDAFNAANRFLKRGLALMPSRQCCFFEADFMDQQGCLVQIYRDGTVHVTHGGVEMGQGIHTKMALIAADTLGIPSAWVRTGETSTDKVPNSQPTAASSGSDLNGWAVFNACQQLNARLDKVRASEPERAWTWKELVWEAYMRKVNLNSSGHYAAPNIVYDYETKKGRTSFYYVWAAVLAEVEIDVLTAEMSMRRMHIVIDVGRSLNPAIDIGQLEGGLAQGIGLMTMEEPIWAGDGHLRTRNVSTYKIPSTGDIPAKFDVTLLANANNKLGGVFNQKSSGEIGVQSGVCVLLAVRDAIRAYRAEQGDTAWFRLDAPATIGAIGASLGVSVEQLSKLGVLGE